MFKKLLIVLALVAGFLGATAAPSQAATQGGRCVEFYGCSTNSTQLNLSTAKPYYLGDTTTVQHYLWNDGWFSSAQDGRYGPRTRDAVIRFQRYYYLTADGIVGRNTWDCLQLCPRGWRAGGGA